MAKRKNKSKRVRTRIGVRQTEPANGEEVVQQMPGTLSTPANVCRLCETKEGPFLNICSSEKNTAKKIDELMPFTVAENDELPQQICFRCSAKVEELHEYIQKCIKTQHNFYSSLGKRCPIPTSKIKTHRSMWEAALTKSNISNDAICDAVVKKAMEGIKDTVVKKAMEGIKDTTLSAVQKKMDIRLTKEKKCTYKTGPQKQTETGTIRMNDRDKKTGVKSKKRNPIQNNEDSFKMETLYSDNSNAPHKNKKPTSRSPKLRNIHTASLVESENLPKKMTRARASLNKSANEDLKSVLENKKEKNVLKPDCTESDVNRFSIMDHVTMIKVNGVGVLFQCKLCNRNFLKKEVVLSHWCAKNGTAKEEFIKKVVPPVVPKLSTVKYINTKTDINVTNSQSYINNLTNTKSKQEVKEDLKPVYSVTKPKPKIGPASKVKKTFNDPVPTVGMKVTSRELTPPLEPIKKLAPSVVQCATAPSLNCRYKLVPGPNHTFTLVEILQNERNNTSNEKNNIMTKRKFSNEKWSDSADSATRAPKIYRGERGTIKIETNPEIIDLEETSVTNVSSTIQPYPVGLFKSVKPDPPEHEPSTSALIPFITSAQKKQSYTVVQTGNPSKLLISAKPQHHVQEFTKKQKKRLIPTKLETPHKQPIYVPLQNAMPSDNDELFNFMNLDPLLHPSYVLPTDSIIDREPQTPAVQITENSSNVKVLYTCNMCETKFTKEHKLLAHIQAHYEKIDKEDIMRQEKAPGKCGNKC